MVERETLTPRRALSLMEAVIEGYTARLVRSYRRRIRALSEWLIEDPERADVLAMKRGFLTPLARALFDARRAAFLFALDVTSRESTGSLLFQVEPIFTLPPEEAIRFLLRKRVLSREEFDRLNEVEQFYTFTVARVSEEKLLDDIRMIIVNHLHAGSPQREIERALRSILPSFTQARIELIARQNIRQAALAGRFEQMWRSRDVRPFVQWKTMEDDRVRPAHRALHNQIWPIESVPIWPPAGFNCRCWVIQLSEDQTRGQQIIRIPGSYRTIDGHTLRVGRVEDISTYSISGEPLRFDFVNRPEALAVRTVRPDTPPPPPRTLERLEEVLADQQERVRVSHSPIRRFVWISPHEQPAVWAWWNPHTKEIHLQPFISQVLQNALDKLSRRQPLSPSETEAIKTVLHELLHTRGDQDFSDYHLTRRQFEIEVVNELHARLRLRDFVKDLGFDPSLLDASFLKNGHAYEGWVNPLIEALEAIGIGRVEALSFFERLNLHEPTRSYYRQILDLVFTKLRPTETERRHLEDLFDLGARTGKLREFADEVKRLARGRTRLKRWRPDR